MQGKHLNGCLFSTAWFPPTHHDSPRFSTSSAKFWYLIQYLVSPVKVSSWSDTKKMILTWRKLICSERIVTPSIKSNWWCQLSFLQRQFHNQLHWATCSGKGSIQYQKQCQGVEAGTMQWKGAKVSWILIYHLLNAVIWEKWAGSEQRSSHEQKEGASGLS